MTDTKEIPGGKGIDKKEGKESEEVVGDHGHLEPKPKDDVVDEELKRKYDPDAHRAGAMYPGPKYRAIVDPTLDNWENRSEKMCCRTCMVYTAKKACGKDIGMGRCRRHAPTMAGFPVVFASDWCGDHKLDENKIK